MSRKIRILGDSNTTYVQQKFKECHLSIYAVNDVNGMSTILRGCLEAGELNYIMHYFEASHMSLQNGLKSILIFLPTVLHTYHTQGRDHEFF